jgi:hypothetical protein
MMTTINRPVVQNGKIVMQRDYHTSANNTNNTDKKATAKENGADLKNNATDTVSLSKAFKSDMTTVFADFRTGQTELDDGLKKIRQQTMPKEGASLAPKIKPNTIAKQGGNAGITQKLFGQLFKNEEAMKNFTGFISGVTKQSKEDVGKVMKVAQGLFEKGELDLVNASSFIATALGLNKQAVELIATAYVLMSNPFTMAGAAALLSKAVALIAESKKNKTKANESKASAGDKQNTAMQQWAVAQQRMQQTAVEQDKIDKVIQTLKANKELTEEQLRNLATMNQQIATVDPKLMQQQALQQPNNLGLGSYATAPTLNRTIHNTNGLTQQGVGNNIQQPIIMATNIPTVAQPPAVSFSPPAFSGKF